MERTIILFIISALFLLCLNCVPEVDWDELSVIPNPSKLKRIEGKFELDNKSKVIMDSDDEQIKFVSNFLIERLNQATKFNLLTEKYKDFVGKHVYISEKMDGSSSTFYIKDGQFGVCSRNLELIESEVNTFWSFARKNELKSKMIKLNRNIALQGEILGPGIQKNKYNLSVHDIYFFTGFDIDSYKRLSFNELRSVLIEIDLNIVPIIEEDFILPKNHNVIINFADGKSILNNKINREGIVIRGINDNFSFKVISNIFLLKNND